MRDTMPPVVEPTQAADRPLDVASPVRVGTRPFSPDDFPGCEAVRVPRDRIEDFEGRVEYWDARRELAMIVGAGSTLHHEWPAARLAAIAERIAASRGLPIVAGGTADLVRRDKDGGIEVLMAADQFLFVRPLAGPELPERIDVERDPLPDVVLEVDHSTDARRGKLGQYERWGFPEVWIDVPDAPWPGRPGSRASAATIYLLERGAYRIGETSRAFPGFTAAEIHRAINERFMSVETVAALRRVGRLLGAAEGTGPDDDPWLKQERDEGRAEGRADMVRAILQHRGLAIGGLFAERTHDLEALPKSAILQAAMTCSDADDFFATLARLTAGIDPPLLKLHPLRRERGSECSDQ